MDLDNQVPELTAKVIVGACKHLLALERVLLTADIDELERLADPERMRRMRRILLTLRTGSARSLPSPERSESLQRLDVALNFLGGVQLVRQAEEILHQK